jgi:hypothetical protein
MELASRYVFVGLIWLVAAMIEGFWMGLTGAMQYLTLHVGMVLSGGVMGIAFGLVLRAWPKVAGDRWAFPQFLLWNFGVLGQALGAVARAWGWGDALIAAASLVVLAAALLMLAMFYRNALGDQPVLSAGRTGRQGVHPG